MKTKKDLLAEAKQKGIDIPSDAKKSEIREALEKGSSDAMTAPSAGVEGRSIDSNDGDAAEKPNAEQSEEGTFEKAYILLQDQFDEEAKDRYSKATITAAQQVGLRATEEPTFTTEEQGDEHLRVTFTMPVEKASKSDLAPPEEQVDPKDV